MPLGARIASASDAVRAVGLRFDRRAAIEEQGDDVDCGTKSSLGFTAVKTPPPASAKDRISWSGKGFVREIARHPPHHLNWSFDRQIVSMNWHYAFFLGRFQCRTTFPYRLLMNSASITK